MMKTLRKARPDRQTSPPSQVITLARERVTFVEKSATGGSLSRVSDEQERASDEQDFPDDKVVSPFGQYPARDQSVSASQ